MASFRVVQGPQGDRRRQRQSLPQECRVEPWQRWVEYQKVVVLEGDCLRLTLQAGVRDCDLVSGLPQQQQHLLPARCIAIQEQNEDWLHALKLESPLAVGYRHKNGTAV